MSYGPFEWTPDRIAYLEKLWHEGISTADIGRLMGVSKNTIVGKVHRLPHLPPRPSPIIRKGERQPWARGGRPRKQTTPAPKLAFAVLPPAPPRPPPPVVFLQPKGGPCCWPLGEPRTPSFRFCGDPSISGKPYCPEHCAVGYVRVVRDAA